MSILNNKKFSEVRPGVYMENATKNLLGFNKTLRRSGRQSNWSKAQLALSVRGTFDELAKDKWAKIRKYKIEHPTDEGYFKDIVGLSEKGKERLAELRAKRGQK